MIQYDKYEPIIGLEVHIQLLTKSKAFCSDATEYGGMPNTQVSPISLGHPGTMPFLNKQAVEFAIRLGIACKSNITKINEFARKNYFYADLPKGYQITQHKTPICTGGYITIKNNKVTLTRIHMEEDTGKSNHELDFNDTLIDLNRAGIPLLEIVTEPVIKNAEEAQQYLNELKRLIRYLDICDGDMEKGSMRCDANVSVRLKGTTKFGTKVEVKNMNSTSNVKDAIDYEIKRQIEAIENGETINQETRNYDALKRITVLMRTKESADEYRYFPEPDLSPVIILEEEIARIKNTLPPLPEELYKKYTEDYGLSDYNARIIIENKNDALYFEKLVS